MPIQLSGSLVITGSITTTGIILMSGSIASASYSSTSDLLQGTGSVGFATTASFNAVSSSQQQISSSQQQISASLLNVVANYATTGSNSFRANQSITGSLVVSSTITAQTLVVQTVTSSIVYSSGSNIFGSALGDRQTFTGSLNITGSQIVYGSIGLNKAVPQRQYTQVANANGIVFAIQNVAASNEGFIVGFDSPGSTYLQLSDSTNAAKIYLNSSGSSYFTGGNVGIGSTTPSNRLDIIGVSGSAGIISPLYVRGWNATTNIGGTETSYGGIHLSNNLDTTVALRVLGSGHAQLSTDASGRFISFGTDAFVERMRIASGGNVGIGTTSPNYALVVKSSTAGSNRIQLLPATDFGFYQIDNSGGTVYIGTDNSTGAVFGQGNYSMNIYNSYSSNINFYSSGLLRQQINTAGAVTKPYQPFVIGGLDGNQSISLNTFTILNFSTTVGMFYYANVGSCWNNTTRTFTAPVTGVYMVNVSLLTDSVGQVAFYVNGARKHSIPSWLGATSATWGGSAMIPLTAGEALTLQGYGNAGTVTQNTFHTFFSIYLLG